MTNTIFWRAEPDDPWDEITEGLGDNLCPEWMQNGHSWEDDDTEFYWSNESIF